MYLIVRVYVRVYERACMFVCARSLGHSVDPPESEPLAGSGNFLSCREPFDCGSIDWRVTVPFAMRLVRVRGCGCGLRVWVWVSMWVWIGVGVGMGGYVRQC